MTQLLLDSGLAASMAEARRKINEGGVRVGSEKVVSVERTVGPDELPALLSLGKRKVRLVSA